MRLNGNSDFAKNSELTIMKVNGSGLIVIKESVGVRSKMCSYINDNNENSETAKGIMKIVIKIRYQTRRLQKRTVQWWANLSQNENNRKRPSSTWEVWICLRTETKVHKHTKKELGQYPAILTSRLVNNPYHVLNEGITRYDYGHCNKIFNNNFLSIYPKEANR